jgi:DNA primase
MFRDRLLFPIFDAMGNIVGFGGRTLGDDQPKYLNTPETSIFQKQRNLFGLYQARQSIQDSKQVVVVEGYTDCIAPFQAGIMNVVATLGTAMTEQHVQQLRRYADEIVLIFDADLAGQKASDRALDIFLTLGVDVKLSKVTSGKDPCDLVISEGGEAFSAVIKSAIGALDYRWKQLKQQYDVSGSITQKRQAVDDLLRSVAACDPFGRIDVIQKGLLLTRLATLLNVSSDELHGQLQKYRRTIPKIAQQQQNTPEKLSMPKPETHIQAAYYDILETLICEPAYISSISEKVSPQEFEPITFQTIAGLVWKCYEELGEFSLTELLALVEEPELADIIIQLHREGFNKQNFAQTIEDALRCLADSQREKEASEFTQRLGAVISDDEAERHLQEIYSRLQSTSPRRTPGAMVD